MIKKKAELDILKVNGIKASTAILACYSKSATDTVIIKVPSNAKSKKGIVTIELDKKDFRALVRSM